MPETAPLRLNIGCGYARLEGWLNLDSSPESAADRLMEAQDLDLPGACAEEIKALQLVEHLGFFRAKYFLSECWRVLKPGGRLVIETPDIEKTFRIFLEGDHRAREAALGWVYGPETPGMGHVYCFPKELLEELLCEAGFSVSKEEFMSRTWRPALRFACVKTEGGRQALNAALRRRLLDKGLVPFRREEESAALETAVRRLVTAGGNSAAELELALVSAPAAMEYFSLAEENEARPSREAAACARLVRWDTQGRLAAEFASKLGARVPERAAYEAAMALGRGLILAALAGDEPYGPEPAADAPAAFTAETAASWAFRRRAAGPRSA